MTALRAWVFIALTGIAFATPIGSASRPTAPASAARALEQTRGANPVIVGRVVNGVTKAPVPGAVVTADVDNGRSQTTGIQADSGGAFAISDVSRWPVVLRSSKPGYIAGSLGQRYAGDSPVPVNAADVRESLTVPLWPAATMAGRVVDDGDDRVAGVRVEAMRLQMVGGRKRFVTRGSALTDDKGEYRISGLISGTYLVAIPHVASGGDQTSLTRYFADAWSPDAAMRLDLAPGAERLNVDFVLRPVKGFEVRGRLRGLPDGSVAALRLSTLAPDESAGVPVFSTEVSGGAGRFVIPTLPPGNYLLSAVSFPFAPASPGLLRGRQQSDGTGLANVMPGRGLPLAPVPDEPTYWAEQRITVVDRAIGDLEVTLTEGGRFRGRVTFDGSGPSLSPAILQSIPVIVQTADGSDFGSFPIAGLDANGGFTTVGLPAGRYIPLVFTGIGWYQGSVDVRGVRQETDGIEMKSGDVSDIEIHMTSTLTTLRGTVRTSGGLVAPRATVYVFPENQARWIDSGALVLRLLECRTGSDGTYSRPGIQPGRYYVVANMDGAGEMWRDPEVLRLLSLRAKTIEILAGQTASVDLTVQPASEAASYLGRLK